MNLDYNIFSADVPFPVFQFCKKNGIECSWDFSNKERIEWTEILLDEEIVMQVDKTCEVNQFVELCILLNEDFKNAGEKVSGKDFWFAAEESTFKKFFEVHQNIFNNYKKKQMKKAQDYIDEFGSVDGDQFSTEQALSMINKARIDALNQACKVVKTNKLDNSGSYNDAGVDITPIIELIKQCH